MKEEINCEHAIINDCESEETIEKALKEVAGKYWENEITTEQQKAIEEKIKEGKPILIRGFYRTGKSIMVERLRKEFNGRGFLVDGISYTSLIGKEINDFQKHFGETDVIKFVAENEYDSGAGEKKEMIRERMEKSNQAPFDFLNSYSYQKNEKLLLFIDEILDFKNYPEKLKHIANLKNLSNLQPVIILQTLPDGNPPENLFAGYETYYMKPFSIEETRTLVNQPLKGEPVSFDESAIRTIFKFTGGWPIEINRMCYELFELFQENGNLKSVYNSSDVEQLVGSLEKSIEDGIGDLKTYSHIIDNYRTLCRLMNDSQRQMIDDLIGKGEVPVSEIDSNLVQQLVDLSVVITDGRVYRVNGELFKQVVSNY